MLRSKCKTTKSKIQQQGLNLGPQSWRLSLSCHGHATRYDFVEKNLYFILLPYIYLLLKSSLNIVWLYFLKQPSKWISNIYFVDINLISAELIVYVCFECVYHLFLLLDSELLIYLISIVDINLMSTVINYSCLKMLISTCISRWYQHAYQGDINNLVFI